ncbi:MAG: hypothetical protein NE334_16775 [Lentisphaeraceae bacterium]|nr:hypothetical protein [Lentisphaeraceae bacterium]
MRTVNISLTIYLSCIIWLAANQEHQVKFAKNTEGYWRVFINGQETPIRGAGGVQTPGMLETFSKVGGNFTRTWGIGSLEEPVAGGKRYIDRAHELGVSVMAGLWIAHERHGFDYNSKEQIKRQREHVRNSIRKWKHHPGIAIWGLGNEMEGPQSKSGNPAMWRELEVLAKIIRSEDPNRPIMTVIAGSSQSKIQNIQRYCPSIDALGINSYGAAGGAGSSVIQAGWKKPFAITEFGIKGFWEAPKTSWGAPIEPNSSEKAKSYFATHKMVTQINTGKEQCLGTFAFLWGWKQEKTSTWFGMYLVDTKEKLPQVDGLVKAWTGIFPENRSPIIKKVEASFFGKRVQAKQRLTASVVAIDKDDDELSYDWLIVEESKAHSVGGDKEYAPPAHPELTIKNGKSCKVIAPRKSGAYRLFLTIRDGQGNAATANIPFYVN